MFEELKGKVIREIKGAEKGNDEILFVTDDATYIMYHQQDCCEEVYIEDICGNIEDVIGNEVLYAEERSNSGNIDCGSETWTFYEIATVKGSVTIRWYGTSNGYYSESVDFEKV